MAKKLLVSISFLILFISHSVCAQVTISPTAVFLDKNSKVGSFYVSNPSDTAVEVRLSFEFAYPATDSTGNVFLNYDDDESEQHFSLEPYLRAFPATFLLEPDQRQTVRLAGRIPADSSPGMYWTRMRVSSNQESPAVGEISDGEVSAQVSFQIDQVTAVMVQHGEAETGLTIHATHATLQENRLIILTDVERTGNAPFLGSVQTRISDSANNIIDSRRTSTSVYFRNKQRVEFDTSSWPRGEYRVETAFESSRNDISSQNLLQISEKTESTTFLLE